MLINLFQFMLSFVCHGIEIVMFFLAIRMILLFKPAQWLQAFDEAGRTLVDGVNGFIDRSTFRLWKRHLTIKNQLVLTFVLLEVCRAMLMQIYQCI